MKCFLNICPHSRYAEDVTIQGGALLTRLAKYAAAKYSRD